MSEANSKQMMTGAIIPEGTEIEFRCANKDCPECYSETLTEPIPSHELDDFMLDADDCEEWDHKGFCPNCKKS